MAERRNIFIEGLQGSGKSTLLTKLSEKFQDYRVYREGDISPVELAWCSYMTPEEYEKVFAEFPDLRQEIESHTQLEQGKYITAYTLILADNRKFYEYMEQHEIYNGRIPLEEFCKIIYERYRNFWGAGNLFECSFFQNAMEDMMLFYQLSDEEILEFYRGAYEQMEKEHFCICLLYTSDAADE